MITNPEIKIIAKGSLRNRLRNGAAFRHQIAMAQLSYDGHVHMANGSRIYWDGTPDRHAQLMMPRREGKSLAIAQIIAMRKVAEMKPRMLSPVMPIMAGLPSSRELLNELIMDRSLRIARGDHGALSLFPMAERATHVAGQDHPPSGRFCSPNR